ncbi:hypothetical protein M433DRAFT_9187 [Acidomyces richmondensis BFW]|nr:hypothetical protein M433DRAFT_9187 [Acidomyces richmondensis BFW]
MSPGLHQNTGESVIIAEINPTEKAYKELSKRIKHLLTALPPAYRSTRSTINA